MKTKLKPKKYWLHPSSYSLRPTPDQWGYRIPVLVIPLTEEVVEKIRAKCRDSLYRTPYFFEAHWRRAGAAVDAMFGALKITPQKPSRVRAALKAGQKTRPTS